MQSLPPTILSVSGTQGPAQQTAQTSQTAQSQSAPPPFHPGGGPPYSGPPGSGPPGGGGWPQNPPEGVLLQVLHGLVVSQVAAGVWEMSLSMVIVGIPLCSSTHLPPLRGLHLS